MDTLRLTRCHYFLALAGNAVSDSAICTEGKVNLPQQFAENDHATQPNTVLTLMKPVTAETCATKTLL